VRCWPVIIKTVTLLASLSAIRVKAATHFKKWQGIRHSAEDLAGTVIEKIVERLFGGPRGNPGAWIWAIICRVGSDHWRSVAREEKHFGKRLVSAHLQSYSDATCDIGVAAERFLGNLPTMEGEIVESLLKGDSVAAITQRMGLSESAIRQMFKKLNVHRGRSRRGVNDP
jgi:DNA-directed RNA polymerase specialized sigma24 family protein